MNKIRVGMIAAISCLACVALAQAYRSLNSARHPASKSNSSIAAATARVPPAKQDSLPDAGSATAGPTLNAAPALAVSDRSFRDEEAVLQREKRILTLQADVAELKRKVASGGEGRSQGAAPVAVMPLPMSGEPSESVATLSLDTALKKLKSGSPGDLKKAEPNDFSLLGTMLNGSHTIAMISDHGSATFDVSVGSVLSDGWTIAQITPTSIRIVRGHASRIISVHS